MPLLCQQWKPLSNGWNVCLDNKDNHVVSNYILNINLALHFTQWKTEQSEQKEWYLYEKSWSSKALCVMIIFAWFASRWIVSYLTRQGQARNEVLLSYLCMNDWAIHFKNGCCCICLCMNWSWVVWDFVLMWSCLVW